MNAQEGYRCCDCSAIWRDRINAQTCCSPERVWTCGKCDELYSSKERAEACCEEKEEPRYIDPNQRGLFEESEASK